jgi:hypothetical protein
MKFLVELLSRRKPPARRTPHTGPWPLDFALFRWSTYPNDVFTLADAYQDVIAFGQKGSGKTSSSGRLFALKYLRAGFAGLVLCAQEEEADNWRGYLKETGREGDGRFFTLDGEHRFNPLAWEAGKVGGSDFSESIVNLILDCSSLKKVSQPTGDGAHFWLPQRKKLIRNAVSLLMLADEPVTLFNLYEVLNTAPVSTDEANTRDWKQQSYLSGCLGAAEQKNPLNPDLKIIEKFFLREWAKLPAKGRSYVESDVTGLLDPLTKGVLSKLFGGDSNLSPDDIEAGRVIIVDIPMRHRDIAQYAAVLWIQMVQRAATRRLYRAPISRPGFIFVDETQYYLTPGDALFQSTSRHHGYSVVRLTQNLPGLRSAYGSDDDTNALLSHCTTRIFHLNSCAITNEWAAKSIGQGLTTRRSVSEARSGEPTGTSVTETRELSCPPENFLTLKSGGARHQKVVEAIVNQPGRTFLDGRTWITLSSTQVPKAP